MSNCTDSAAAILFLFRHKTPFATTVLILSPFVVILNFTLTVAFIATKQAMQNTSSLLIVCLSASDFVTGAVSMPLIASVLLNTHSSDVCIKATIYLIFSSLGNFSAALTVLIALDRYLHINPSIINPTSRLAKMFTMPYIFLLIAVIFCLIIAFGFYIALIGLDNPKTFAITGTIFAGFLSWCILSVIFFYTKGYLRIRKFTDESPIYAEKVGSKVRPKYIRSLYQTVFLLGVLVCISYLPLCVVQSILAILVAVNRSRDLTVWIYFYEVAAFFYYSSSLTNCIVVYHFNKKAKDWWLRKIIKGHRSERTTSS